MDLPVATWPVTAQPQFIAPNVHVSTATKKETRDLSFFKHTNIMKAIAGQHGTVAKLRSYLPAGLVFVQPVAGDFVL